MRLKALIALFTGLLAATSLASAQVPAQAPVGPPPLDPENTLLLDLSTGGRVTIQLRPDMAPGHVERVKTLVRRGFYNGLTFHRVIEGFMAQGGDPKGDGTGGSDLPDIKAEFNALPHLRGTLSAARAESPDSANSQFFLMLVPRLSMDGKYTAYGRVVSGMNFVDALNRGEPPAEPSRILKASIAADGAAPPTAAESAAPAPPALQVPAPAVQVPAPAGAATTPQ
ncbi:MAG TPA: peptidylprolyl isomerase [Allosphingosinicella sp.]|jgi:peptidylprolyl isomerase